MSPRPAGLPKLFPEVVADIKALPPAARPVALRLLLELQAGTLRGVALESMASTGDLTGCFKIYFDDEPGRLHRRYRIVYRELAGQFFGVSVEVVAVGPKRLLEVYATAAERLAASTRPVRPTSEPEG